MDMLQIWGPMVCCCILSISFVLTLYLVDPGLPRNHPTTVKRRILAITGFCLIAPCTLYLYMGLQLQVSTTSFVSLLGFKWSGLAAAMCYPTLLVLTLYGGLIFHYFVDEKALFGILDQRKDIIMRNYVIAPFAEELIFRACMLFLLQPAAGEWYAVLLCPIFFGIAHVHHLIDWYRINDGTPFHHACLSVIIQICYTSTFGLFAGFLFVRTGHLASLVLCHSICNMMGLPPIERALEHSRKYVILAVYVVGAVLFLILLFPLTTPSLYE